MDTMLEQVKTLLGITGNYQDDTINEYIIEVKGFLADAGVPEQYICAGVVARGVSDLWNYGAVTASCQNTSCRELHSFRTS